MNKILKTALAGALSLLFFTGVLTQTALGQDGTEDGLPIPRTPAEVSTCSWPQNVGDELQAWGERLGINCTFEAPSCVLKEGDCSTCCILANVIKVKNYLFYGILFTAVFVGLWGAGQVVWQARQEEDPKKAASGAKKLILAALGVLLALVVRYAPGFVLSLLGVS